jgi:cytochrome o ubiquinol oxidase operon protein cyoD
MSAHQAAHPHHADAGHHGDGHAQHVGPHSSLREYLIGFGLSVVLTAIPFWLIMAKVITERNTGILVLGAFAVVQVLVHMVYFLHMNARIEGGWTMLSTIFTLIFVGIAIAGTLWVMFHMNAHMMPSHSTPEATSLSSPPGKAISG